MLLHETILFKNLLPSMLLMQHIYIYWWQLLLDARNNASSIEMN